MQGIVEFDGNWQGIFHAGQLVSGKVTITLEKPQQVRGIAIKVEGFAHTSWYARRPGGHEHRHFYGHEEYLSCVTYALGSSNGPKVLLEKGVYCYQFAAILPETCPSSVEGAHGHIRYKVKVVLERPWAFDKSFARCFTVLSPLDLNKHGDLVKTPVHEEAVKTFRVWPVASGPLRLEVNMPQSGFVAGQVIPISVLCANESDIAVESIVVRLSMLTQFTSQRPWKATKSNSVRLASIEGAGVMRNMRKLHQFSLTIPATPSTCVNCCSIIEVSYQIEVEAKMGWKHMNQSICLPIIVGNMPLRQSLPCSVEKSQSSVSKEEVIRRKEGANQDPAASTSARSVLPWHYDPSLPPPSYEKVTGMMSTDNGEEHDPELDKEREDFAPYYPFYDIPSVEALTEAEIEKLFSDLELD